MGSSKLDSGAIFKFLLLSEMVTFGVSAGIFGWTVKMRKP